MFYFAKDAVCESTRGSTAVIAIILVILGLIGTIAAVVAYYRIKRAAIQSYNRGEFNATNAKILGLFTLRSPGIVKLPFMVVFSSFIAFVTCLIGLSLLAVAIFDLC